MIEIVMISKITMATRKEGLVVWIEVIVIHYEGHVNIMIQVYSGYSDMCNILFIIISNK